MDFQKNSLLHNIGSPFECPNKGAEIQCPNKENELLNILDCYLSELKLKITVIFSSLTSQQIVSF